MLQGYFLTKKSSLYLHLSELLGTDCYASQGMALTEIKPFAWTFFLFAHVMVEVALLNKQKEKNYCLFKLQN